MSARLRISGEIIPLDCKLCLEFKDEAKELDFRTGQLKPEFIKLIRLKYNDYLHDLYRRYGSNSPIEGYLESPYNRRVQFIFKRKSDRRKEYTTQIRIPNDTDILKCFSEIRLCDLDLGTFEFTEANILHHWEVANELDRYDNGDSGVFPFYANFGQWLGDGTLVTSDIRLAISDLFILQQAAKHCGFCFDAPVMQSIRERHAWTYAYKESGWWNYEGHGLLGEASTEKTNFQITTNVQIEYYDIPMDSANITVDNGSNLSEYTTDLFFISDYTALEYTNSTNATQCYKICFSGEFSTSAIYGEFGMGVSVQSTEIIQSMGQSTDDVSFNFCMEVDVPAGESIRFLIRHELTDVVTPDHDFNYLNIDVSICSKNHYPGDIVPINQLLSCEKTVLDILKDNSALYSTLGEQQGRNFFMSAPYTVEVDGEQIEGFFRSKYRAKRLDVVCESYEGGEIIEAANRVIRCFADSNDEYISERLENGTRTELETNYGVLSYEFERGLDNNKLDEECLRCFEPMLNDFESNIEDDTSFTIGGEGGIFTPQIKGDSKGFRKFYIYNGQQLLNGSTVPLRFNGAKILEYPTIYQELPSSVEILNSVEWNGQQLTMKELHVLYGLRYAYRFAKSENDKFYFVLSWKQYNELSFRDYHRITYTDTQGNNSDYVGILREKKHNSCGKTVEMIFRKEDTDC